MRLIYKKPVKVIVGKRIRFNPEHGFQIDTKVLKRTYKQVTMEIK